MLSTFDCCSTVAGKLPSKPSIREFRVFRRRRLKHHHRTAFTVRSHSNPFQTLFHTLISQVTTVNSLDLIAPSLGFSSAVALYLSNVVSAKNSSVSDIGEWVLLSSPTPFNRFVFLRCPSVAIPGSDTNLVEEDGHFVRLHSGRIKAGNGDDPLEDKFTYQRLCMSSEDGGVISLDWPSNLTLREEQGLDTTLLLVPGTPEGSMDRNVRLAVIEALGRGLFPIVMNPRGCAGSPLTTARLFSAADSDDIYTAVQFISKARPWTALMAIGWGYGANMLTKYLAEAGERTPLTAATCIDNPFDLEEATKTPPYHMAIDQDLTGGLINILRSNKELFQGKEKGFDVEKALEAKSVRDFEKLISSVSHGFNSIEDFYSKSSTRNVVGNVKIPVLYIQNDNGSAPIFSIPRSLIAENPFTSLLLCSYSPSSIISSMQPVLSWCQQLSIEWLTAVELGLLKGRHPLLKDVDITINSSRGLALVEGRTVEERGKVIRQLDFNSSDASSGYQSTSFIKEKLEESHSSIRTDLRSQNDSQSKSQLGDKGSLQIEVRVLDQTSSISADMGKEDEVSSEDTEKGQLLRTAEVVMNILDITNPGFLTEEEKKKVWNAVDKGETLMKALQDAVPEEVRGKLTTAVSGILHAQGSNLKAKDLVDTSHNATLELKKKTEEKVRYVAVAEGSSQIASPLHEMGDVNDVSDGSDSHQPTKYKFIGELESEPPFSDKLQKSIDQSCSQALGIHGDDTISSVRKETSGSGNTDSDDEFSGENTAQYLDNSEKELDRNVKAEQVGSHNVAIGDNFKDQGGGIAQSHDKEENKPKKNEEKPVDPSNNDKVVSFFTKEEGLSLPGSTSEAQPGEQEYNNDQKDHNNTQPVVEHTKPVVSESNVNDFSVSQALDALAGIDDSTQVVVNNVFNVIENMISELEGSENEGEDKKTDSLFDNHCSGNEMSSGKKECGNMDSSVKPERLNGPRTNNILERRGDSEHDVTSGREGEEFTSHLVPISGSYVIRSQSAAQAGKDGNENDKLLDDLDGNVDMATNVYLDSLHNNFVLKYDASNAPTKSLDKDTTTALLLDYIPEEGQWKFIEQPRNGNGAVSTCEGVDGQVNGYAHAKVKNTDGVIEPLYIILDSDNQPEPVGEYQTTVNGKEEIEGNDESKDLEYFVRTIIQDCLQVEVGRRLSAANKGFKLGVHRDIEHVANLLSVAVGYGSGLRQSLGSKSDSIDSMADKMGTLSGEQIIRSISSSVQETVYLKKVLPLGVIIGSSLAALRKSFHVTTLHDDNQGECLAVDQAKKSGERNHGEVNNEGEPTQNVILTDTVCGEGGGAEMRNLNKDTVVVGAVTAALGASALLVHQQVWNAVDKGETLMKALQDAVPEEVRGKLTTAVSGILHAQGSNLKAKDLVDTSHNATLELKKKTEEKVRYVAVAEGSSQIASPLHEMGDVNDVSDGSDSHQPTKYKFIGELESEPPFSDKLQKSIDQSCSQALGIHGDDTISSVRKETSGSGNTDSDDEFSGENTAQYLDNSEKELDRNVKAEQVGSHNVAIGDNFKDQGGGIAQSHDKEENKPKKNEEKPVDPSNNDKVVSFFTKEEGLSLPGSTSEAQPGEQEYNNDQKDHNNTQPVVEHTKPVVSESNVNDFSVSQALDALAGIDDSTQVVVNNVFNVIENMISELEGSENEGEDKKTDSLFDNHCSGNEMSSGKKECGNMDSSVKPERLNGPRTNNILERRGDSEHDVTSGREGEEFTSHLVPISGSYVIRSQSAAQAGKDGNENDKLLDDLDGNVDMATNVYLDSLHNNFVLKYDASNAPTKSLDKDTTTALLLDYIPEEGQWKFIEQPRNGNGAVSTCEGVDGQVNGYAHAKVKNTDGVIEPLYIILDSDNQPEPVGEYQTTVNGKEEIEGNDESKDLEYFVRTIIQDCLQVEVGRRLSAANKGFKLGVHRDIEHVANLLSVAVGYGSGLRQSLGSKSDSIDSMADKMGTLSGEQIIRSISSSVQETVYLKKVLPLGVIIGSSLAALRKSFHVTTLHDDNQGECLAVDQAKKSGERNHGEVNNEGEPTQNVILTDTVCGEGGGAEMRNLNKDTVVVGAVTAALGASALLVHQQNLCEADETTESSFKSKEKASLQKEPERHDEQILQEKNHNIVTAFAEKAMSVASPVVPKKEDGEVDEERLVSMLAELREKGGILKLVGRIALLWGGIRTAMSVTEKLISILQIAERPLFQRILGSVGLVLVLWSPITLPLLPKLIDGWTSHTPSKIVNLACGFGLYIALTILVMMWGKRIRGYENPAKEYGLDLTSWSKINDFTKAFFGGVSVLLGIQFVNGFLGYTTLSWPAIPTFVNLVSWLKVFGGSLLLVSIGIISSIFVTAVEELLFRSWLTEEIALDLGYYPGIIISGLAFAILQRSLQAIPVLWVLSLGLAGARQRRGGCLSIPIGLRAGITASSFIFQKGGFISYKASIPMHHPVWIMCVDTHQPLSGVAGFAFALLLACIFFPRNPMEKKNLKRTIRE